MHNSITTALPRRLGRLALAGLVVSGLFALTPTGTAPASATTAHHRIHHGAQPYRAKVDREHRALRIALKHRGAPYRYGAAGPHAFDCSGLTSFAFHRAGFRHLPRTSAAQSRFVHRIPRRRMRPGDLVFFYDGSGVYHVGVFDGIHHGRRYIVHAPYSGSRVRREAIWTSSWFAGTLR